MISDLYDEPEAIAKAVRPLRYRGHDVIVFHVLDPAELDFPFDRGGELRGPRDRRPHADRAGGAARASTRRWSASTSAALGRLFTDSRIDYALFNTSVPLDHALFHYLSARERLSRVR